MCTVKTGSLIKTEYDFENLILSIINRQSKPFTKSKLIRLIRKYTENSEICIRKSDQKLLMNVYINNMVDNGILHCQNGIYYQAD